MSDAALGRPDYGLDAPAVVRNLALVGLLGLVVSVSVALGLWQGRVPIWPGVQLEVAPMARGFTLGCGGMAIYMVWSSKVGKRRERERLLDQLSLRGDERVLDIGCGRGLLLVGAARRLPRGQAVGIDLWQAEDLSGNRPEATLENARREGVAVQVETGDMRALPFPDASFDAVVSKAAIHNLYEAKDRALALAELGRVLKPGGQVLLDDIRHLGEYERALRSGGFVEVRRTSGWLASLVLTLVTFGSLRPGVVQARKA